MELKDAIETMEQWIDQWADEQADLDEVSQCDEAEREIIKAARVVLREIRDQRFMAEAADRERLFDVLDEIEKTLMVPAAEYVPAIGDVFKIIDRTKSMAKD